MHGTRIKQLLIHRKIRRKNKNKMREVDHVSPFKILFYSAGFAFIRKIDNYCTHAPPKYNYTLKCEQK